MQLKIISWNIRHFRAAKIEDYIHTLWEVCNWAHVCFIYEDHTGLGKKFAKALNDYEKEHNKTAANWSGGEIRVTDEYVCVVWRTPITVAEDSGAMAKFSELMSGERCPAVVEVTFAKGRTVTIAAWHAYGPAKVSAKDLFQKIKQTDFCDILIGDFNFQTFDNTLQTGGLKVEVDDFKLSHSIDFEVADELPNQQGGVVGKRSKRIKNTYKMKEILPSNHKGSTTYTDSGVGKRTTGLDRCLVKEQYVGAVSLFVAQPKEFDEMECLTDHMPLLLMFEIN